MSNRILHKFKSKSENDIFVDLTEKKNLVNTLNKIVDDKDTLLHLAVSLNDINLVKKIIASDRRLINVVNKAGESPLDLSVKLGNVRITKILLETNSCNSPQNSHNLAKKMYITKKNSFDRIKYSDICQIFSQYE